MHLGCSPPLLVRQGWLWLELPYSYQFSCFVAKNHIGKFYSCYPHVCLLNPYHRFFSSIEHTCPQTQFSWTSSSHQRHFQYVSPTLVISDTDQGHIFSGFTLLMLHAKKTGFLVPAKVPTKTKANEWTNDHPPSNSKQSYADSPWFPAKFNYPGKRPQVVRG